MCLRVCVATKFGTCLKSVNQRWLYKREKLGLFKDENALEWLGLGFCQLGHLIGLSVFFFLAIQL